MMTNKKFNEHDTFDKALILMSVVDEDTQKVIHKCYRDFNSEGIISFDQWREKIAHLWADNFAKVIWYDIKDFIDKVLYHEDVPERCEELPIKISVGNCYLEIPMDPTTQSALDTALKQFSIHVLDEYKQ